MTADPDRYHRRSIRLKGYDYSRAGAYFITVCTHHRECLFGEIIDGEMKWNECGETARRCWLEIPHHFPHVELDEFVVMPNHVHGILVIVENDVGANNHSPLPGATPFRSPSRAIGSIIRGYKIGVTKWFHQNTDIHLVWQRNYYEHIIRDERSLHRIRQYIRDNPQHWHLDQENPQRTGPGRLWDESRRRQAEGER